MPTGGNWSISSDLSIAGSTLVVKTNGNVGIGTTNPGAKLEIAGNIKIVDGTQGAGKVLTSDANGLASWEVVAGDNWGIQVVEHDSTLSGDGTSGNPLKLSNTGVTAGTYGSATQVGVFTVDAQGRITSASNTTISGVSPVGSTLSSGNIWVGDASNQAVEVSVSGDATLSNTGVLTINDGAVTSAKIADGTIVDDDINSNAQIGWGKISKSGSSLVDLETRSAGDLNSGNLDIARMPTGGNWSISSDLSIAGSTLVVKTNGNVGIGTTNPQHKLDINGAIYTRRYGLTYSSSITINWNNGNVQSVVLTGNTTFNFTNGQDGGKYILIIKQDSTGGRTVTWPSSVRFPGGVTPTLSTGANKSDYIGFIYNGVDGKYDAVAFVSGL
jgi:hypothetical protein